jgi:CubicO group peptidase (beta-lactamase class C family)
MQAELFINHFEELKKAFDHSREPGFCAAVIQDQNVIYSESYGLASLENRVALSSDSIFYLASVSKQFTAMCILLLAEKGKLDLSQDVREIIPETRQFEERISIQNLLNHTSGIPDYLSLIGYQLGRHGQDYFDNSHGLEIISKLHFLDFKPNERFDYSNSNYILLSSIVEKISGVSIAQFARQNIFEPMQMHSTTFDDDRFKVINGRVYSYDRLDNESKEYRVMLKNSATVGDGGLLSSLADLIKWESNLQNNTQLPSEVLEALHKSHPFSNGEYNQYANGIELASHNGHDIHYHGGGFDGFGTLTLRVPSQKLSVIYLSNNPSVEHDFDLYKKA